MNEKNGRLYDNAESFNMYAVGEKGWHTSELHITSNLSYYTDELELELVSS